MIKGKSIKVTFELSNGKKSEMIFTPNWELFTDESELERWNLEDPSELKRYCAKLISEQLGENFCLQMIEKLI